METQPKFKVGDYITLTNNTKIFSRVWKIIRISKEKGLYHLESIASSGNYCFSQGSHHTFTFMYVDIIYEICNDKVMLMTKVL